jgi:glutaredoxin
MGPKVGFNGLWFLCKPRFTREAPRELICLLAPAKTPFYAKKERLKTCGMSCVNGECFMTQTSLEFDTRAKSLAKDYLNTESKLLDLLIQMKRKKVFPELNYNSIFDYCERALNLSRAQSFYFKSVAEKSEEIPEIQKAIAQGNLTLSKARRIVPVITPQNQEAWIEKARTLTQKVLEREVIEVNPKARVIEKLKPVAPKLSELKVGITTETEAHLKRLQKIYSQKKQRFVSLAEVVALMAKSVLEKEAPERRLERAEKRKSGRLSTISSRKLSKTKPLLPKRVPISQKIKLQKQFEAQNQCIYTSSDGRRCPQRLWLELHHVKPVSMGGGNERKNLVYLCSSHHRSPHLSNIGWHFRA